LLAGLYVWQILLFGTPAAAVWLLMGAYRAGAYCCCLLQIRQAVTEFAILPLGSQLAHERLPHIKSLLLYGAPSTGKTMVAQVGVMALQADHQPNAYLCMNELFARLHVWDCIVFGCHQEVDCQAASCKAL
jgi:hypothetical protein